MINFNIEFFGYFAAILTTLAFLPQLIKTFNTKKGRGCFINYFNNVSNWRTFLDYLWI